MISAHDVDNIYKVPLVFRAEGVDDLVLDHFGMEAPLAGPRPSGRRWCAAPTPPRARCGSPLVGKYVQLADAYKSVIEALEHGGFHHGVEVEVELVDSENFDPERLEGVDGILIPGGLRCHDRQQYRSQKSSVLTGAARAFPKNANKATAVASNSARVMEVPKPSP